MTENDSTMTRHPAFSHQSFFHNDQHYCCQRIEITVVDILRSASENNDRDRSLLPVVARLAPTVTLYEHPDNGCSRTTSRMILAAFAIVSSGSPRESLPRGWFRARLCARLRRDDSVALLLRKHTRRWRVMQPRSLRLASAGLAR